MDGDSDISGVVRRDVLKIVGGSALGLTALTGTASAWQFQFYGCSQVCSDSRGSRAVVAVDGGYECRPTTEWNSNRQNQNWKWKSACYEVSGDEAIVGIVESCTPDSLKFCLNPNNCASNYYDTAEKIVAELNESGCCNGNIRVGSCDITGTGSGNHDDRGRNNGNGQSRSRNNGNDGKRGRDNTDNGNRKPSHGNSNDGNRGRKRGNRGRRQGKK